MTKGRRTGLCGIQGWPTKQSFPSNQIAQKAERNCNRAQPTSLLFERGGRVSGDRRTLHSESMSRSNLDATQYRSDSTGWKGIAVPQGHLNRCVQRRRVPAGFWEVVSRLPQMAGLSADGMAFRGEPFKETVRPGTRHACDPHIEYEGGGGGKGLLTIIIDTTRSCTATPAIRVLTPSVRIPIEKSVNPLMRSVTERESNLRSES